jgi:hypothetical protein
MVGDLHFILRHGFAGFMSVFFVIFGMWNAELWLAEGCNIEVYLMGHIPQKCTTIKLISYAKDLEWIILIIAPIVGIMLQGLLAWSNIISYFVTNSAKIIVARRILEVIAEGNVNRNEVKMLHDYQIELERLALTSPDALHYWLYYSDGGDQIIEWVRRRRSYYYLGMNLAMSCLIGIPIGVVICGLINYPPRMYLPPQEQSLILLLVLQSSMFALGILWVLGARKLGMQMKLDADYMEFAWAIGYIHPDFKKRITREMTIFENDGKRA